MTTELLARIRQDGAVIDSQGNRHSLDHEIDPEEERFIRELIASDPTIRRTLEVGLAFGISALTICGEIMGREGAHHIAVDPYQDRLFKNAGIETLRRAGVEFAEVIEERSDVALPRLLSDEIEPFDLVMVDGLHRFDQVLMDLCVGLRLLRVGGYLVVDDCGMPGVQKAVSYVTRYPSVSWVGQVRDHGAFRRSKRALSAAVWHGCPAPLRALLPKRVYDALDRRRWTSMVALRKDAEDTRRSDWYEPF